jgi:apolipoprotein N-acyltransferase
MYRKQKLVPFGEYIPLENLIRRLFPQVTILGQLGMFSFGPSVQPLLSLGNVSLGSTICYEAIFPQVWRRQAKQGAQLFANLTNDAWFFDTDAPYQHLAANVLRAVETGRPVLRAANTGISAIIDGKGNIEQKSGLFESELLRAAVTAEVSAPTFYATYGDWLAWLCAVLFITVVIFSMVFMYE